MAPTRTTLTVQDLHRIVSLAVATIDGLDQRGGYSEVLDQVDGLRHFLDAIIGGGAADHIILSLDPAIGDEPVITFTASAPAPAGRLAEAELRFTTGPLAGLKLIGFGIWERRGGGGRNVTFPARQYVVNGDRRSFALLRPLGDGTATTERVRQWLLRAFAEWEQAQTAAVQS